MTLHADIVVLEQVLSGDPAQDCALKVQALPFDQQYAAQNACVMLSRPISASAASATQAPGCATGAALFVLLVLALAVGALWASLADRRARRARREHEADMAVIRDAWTAYATRPHTPEWQKDHQK